jgi:DMSO/TMAO reductase YedYZ molybdopterin-dependent catalytic subunit
MKDIIERAKPLKRAKYVCMEGADKLVSLLAPDSSCVVDSFDSQMAIMAHQ